MDITISISTYVSLHGAKPRGRGYWAFVMGAMDYEYADQKDDQGRPLVWVAPCPILYSEAKKLALAEAARRRVTLIGVAP